MLSRDKTALPLSGTIDERECKNLRYPVLLSARGGTGFVAVGATAAASTAFPHSDHAAQRKKHRKRQDGNN